MRESKEARLAPPTRNTTGSGGDQQTVVQPRAEWERETWDDKDNRPRPKPPKPQGSSSRPPAPPQRRN